MAKDIQFSKDHPEYVFDRDCLAFNARMDGRPIRCLVSAELLISRFGACDMSEESLRQAFADHQSEIQDMARTHIAWGLFNEQGAIVLTTRFTVLEEEIVGVGQLGRAAKALIEEASAALHGIIGPQAGLVCVTWSTPPGVSADDRIHLTIRDPLTDHSVGATLMGKGSGPDRLSIPLALLWSSILRVRSHQLLLKSG